MAHVGKLFNTNFLEYASYVIKDRAIPDLDDGLKPVQRRILHTLFSVDDGKFHKVANIVGHTMQYHPHGDASIYSALVVLANKDLFIEKQGNFGSLLTGDPASAARYIECRLLSLAKKVLYRPEITEYVDSYDGRNKEPVVFPAKIPVVLIQGAEGIAVGMSTKILPHNFNEVLEALQKALKDEPFELYPDFQTGGLVDVSDYQDGMGKVLVRAKVDVSDPKRILIRELPYGTTTESLISSIENAAKKNKIRIAGIQDYTTDQVEIEIYLARNVHSAEVLDALYAFTDCEVSISVNLLVIQDNKPVLMTVSEVIRHHAEKLVEILRAELKVEQKQLEDRLHARTLERIFVEERIYKKIESMKTHRGVTDAVIKGFEPFHDEIKREVTEEDVERLLKIPIRRISLYDINKNRQEIEEIQGRLGEIKKHLGKIKDYAVSFLGDLLETYGALYPRRSKIGFFEKVDAKDVVQRDIPLLYDDSTGYLGTEVKSGKRLFDVSPYDRVLAIRKNGVYSVIDVPEKLFIDKGMHFCCLAEKEALQKIVFTILYKDKQKGNVYLKRCKIEQFILGRSYTLVPEDTIILSLTTREDVVFELKYKPKPRLKVLEESFDISDYLVKGVKAQGVRLSAKDLASAKMLKKKKQ
ncbi:MAG: DNA topoisomerase IV subunit A [Spirochaetales bacterium]|nr:DNA topoisomerase IV subunit A [Spirochaetales bacterium]